MPEANLFLVFLEPLNRAAIPYMVTGSVASLVYGEPRLTHDVDLVVELNISPRASSRASSQWSSSTAHPRRSFG